MRFEALTKSFEVPVYAFDLKELFRFITSSKNVNA